MEVVRYSLYPSARNGGVAAHGSLTRKESEGYMHMPCGQSGHPLSPHYADSHEAWEQGKPTPFLPGPPVNRLVLMAP